MSTTTWLKATLTHLYEEQFKALEVVLRACPDALPSFAAGMRAKYAGSDGWSSSVQRAPADGAAPRTAATHTMFALISHLSRRPS